MGPRPIRLCPHHRRDVDWAKCSYKFIGCQIKLARQKAAAQRRVLIEIPPDIQAQHVSRQRKLQLAWVRLGLCMICGADKDPASTTRCTRHMIAARERQRKTQGLSRRNFNSASYQSEFKAAEKLQGLKEGEGSDE